MVHMTSSGRRFLFVSVAGQIGDIAWQILKEGHEVRCFIESEEYRETADGFVPKTDDWRRDVDWAEVIVFDDTIGNGTVAEELRRAGKKVIGGTPYTDKLEDDRRFGESELEQAGIHILPHWEFDSFDAGIQHITRNPDRYVLKPGGVAQCTKRWLYVGEEEDGNDVIRQLEAYKETSADQIRVFHLQRKVTGVEVAVGAFFNGHGFVAPVNYNFEHKRLFRGDLGPMTGEMGTSMFWGAPNELFAQTLEKMEPRLAEHGYCGYIDLNCIVNRDGIYPLEFTSRFGYPTISIQQEGMLTPIGAFLHDLASGLPTRLRTRARYQVGVRVVVPPYPFDDPVTFDMLCRGAAIVFKHGTSEGVHIEEVKQVDGRWFVTGGSGAVLVVVGVGSTMRKAQMRAYARLENVVIPHMYYRDDIGDRWADDVDRLLSWGYLRETRL